MAAHHSVKWVMIFQPISYGVVLLVFGLKSLGPGTQSLGHERLSLDNKCGCIMLQWHHLTNASFKQCSWQTDRQSDIAMGCGLNKNKPILVSGHVTQYVMWRYATGIRGQHAMVTINGGNKQLSWCDTCHCVSNLPSSLAACNLHTTYITIICYTWQIHAHINRCNTEYNNIQFNSKRSVMSWLH